MFSLLSSSVSSISHLSNARYLYKTLIQTHLISTMSLALQSHAFTGNPIRSRTPKSADPFSPSSAVETLKTFLLDTTRQSNNLNFKVLPFRSGRPLASSSMNLNDSVPIWHLGWMSLMECQNLLADSEVSLNENSMVYLGYSAADEVVYWGIEVDVSFDDKLVSEFCARKLCFVELRTLMVATDWADAGAMGELAIAGHARALLEWHKISRFCGSCGEKTIPLEGGRRKECSKESCKNRIYPRLDPVVIMLVIDRDNDRALLSRQSRFVPRMWSCLAGFIEPGESLEEAVRRETLEETGIEVGEVVYHSSQPWPVGPTSIPCQLMVGFFAHAKSLEINVDKGELEDAQWHSREDVKAALASADYRSEQRRAAMEVDQMCRGVERGRNPAAVSNVESGEAAPMFIPGPFAIAHHLISSWVYQETPFAQAHSSRRGGSPSCL